MIVVYFVVFFIFINSAFIIILFKILIKKSPPFNSDDPVTKFSIVVAAKNEERNLPNLISSLAKLNYQKDNFEVIIVDDHSSDNTFFITEELLPTFDNFKIVRALNKKYEGKRGALDYGISLAKYGNILITDADCIPETNWLKRFNGKFISEDDFVIGIAPFIQKKTLINKLSCYENFRSTLLTILTGYLGIPFTASARNLGFKRKSFEEIGGYKNTTDTLSGDDDLLLRQAVKNEKKVGILTSKDSFVYSETKKTFKEYFIQRARHTQSSFHYPFKQILFLSGWHTLNILFLFSPLLTFINLLFILPFFIKILFDLLFSILFLEKLNYKFSLVETLYLQFFYEIFLIAHLYNAKFSRIKWK